MTSVELTSFGPGTSGRGYNPGGKVYTRSLKAGKPPRGRYAPSLEAPANTDFALSPITELLDPDTIQSDDSDQNVEDLEEQEENIDPNLNRDNCEENNKKPTYVTDLKGSPQLRQHTPDSDGDSSAVWDTVMSSRAAMPPGDNATTVNLDDSMAASEASELLQSYPDNQLNLTLTRKEKLVLDSGSQPGVTKGKEPRCCCDTWILMAALCLFGLIFIGIIVIQVSRDSTSEREASAAAMTSYLDKTYSRTALGEDTHWQVPDHWNTCAHNARICQTFYLLRHGGVVTMPYDGECVLMWHKGVSAKIEMYKTDLPSPDLQSHDESQTSHDESRINQDESLSSHETFDNDIDSLEDSTALLENPQTTYNHTTASYIETPDTPTRYSITTVFLGDPTECMECLLRYEPKPYGESVGEGKEAGVEVEDVVEDFKQPMISLSLRFPHPSFYTLVSILCL